MKESEKILDIVRSVLVIQNKQSMPLCISRIDDYFKNKKCVHPYDDIVNHDMEGLSCTKCGEKLTD
jgi:hypothetical protein